MQLNNAGRRAYYAAKLRRAEPPLTSRKAVHKSITAKNRQEFQSRVRRPPPRFQRLSSLPHQPRRLAASGRLRAEHARRSAIEHSDVARPRRARQQRRAASGRRRRQDQHRRFHPLARGHPYGEDGSREPHPLCHQQPRGRRALGAEGSSDSRARDAARDRLGTKSHRRGAGARSARRQAQFAAHVPEFGGLGRRQRTARGTLRPRERGFRRFFTPSTTRRANSELIRSIATSSWRYQFAAALAMPRIARTASRVSRSARNSPRRTPSFTTSSNTRSTPRDHFPIRRRLSLGKCCRSFKNTRTKSLRSVNGAKCDLIRRESFSAAVPGPEAIALATSKYPATPCRQTSSSAPSLDGK